MRANKMQTRAVSRLGGVAAGPEEVVRGGGSGIVGGTGRPPLAATAIIHEGGWCRQLRQLPDITANVGAVQQCRQMAAFVA